MARAAAWSRRFREFIVGVGPPMPRSRPPVDFGLPARLSCGRLEDLPFVRQFGPHLCVFLDGDRLRKVFAYDVERGVVERYATNWRGEVELELVDGAQRAKLETVRGRVEVRWRRDGGGGL